MKKASTKVKPYLGLKDHEATLVVTLGDLVDRLSIINLKIWHLENDIRKGGEGRFSLEQVGKIALKVRDLNKERVAYKNALNKIEEKYYNDIKVNHRSAHKEDNSEKPVDSK